MATAPEIDAAEVETKASARVLYKLREQASAHGQLAQILLPTTEAVQAAVNRRVAEILAGLADRYEKEADRG